ncbi:HNH endonuclease [Parvularcula sp. IMCC14364]|uniref:HNH endonuclease n=1 Tax=Parvularcula sp. IMCC14364 TaxID=3067902 RepID=UPI0035567555
MFTRSSRHITRGPRWKALRQKVLRRDGFACVQCGAVRRLEVDHIMRVRTHPDLAWEMDNLQTLCGSCHAIKTRQENGWPVKSKERKEWDKFIKQISIEKSD